MPPLSEVAAVSAGPAVAQPILEPEQGVRLAVKWPIGARYVYRMDMEQHSTNQMPHSAQTTRESVTIGATYALAVQHDAAGGGSELEFEFLANETEIKVDGEIVFRFDSAHSANEAVKVPSPFQKVVGSKVRLALDTSGRVERVIGLDGWATRIAGDAPGPAGQMVVQQFNEGFFQQAADFARSLPEKAVQPGDSWAYQTEVPAGSIGRIALDARITLAAWKKHDGQPFAVLESNGTFKGIPIQNHAGAVQMLLEDGTVAGTTWFDPELGTVIESVVSQAMRLKAEVPAPAEGGGVPGVFTGATGQRVVVKLVEHSGTG